LSIPRLEDVQRKRHAGEQDHRQRKQWEIGKPTNFVARFTHMKSDYGRAADRSQFASEKKLAPRRLGNVAGPSSTPFAERGFRNGVLTDAKRECASGSFKECVRTTPAYESGSTCKCSRACPGARMVSQKTRQHLRPNIVFALRFRC